MLMYSEEHIFGTLRSFLLFWCEFLTDIEINLLIYYLRLSVERNWRVHQHKVLVPGVLSSSQSKGKKEIGKLGVNILKVIGHLVSLLLIFWFRLNSVLIKPRKYLCDVQSVQNLSWALFKLLKQFHKTFRIVDWLWWDRTKFQNIYFLKCAHVFDGRHGTRGILSQIKPKYFQSQPSWFSDINEWWRGDGTCANTGWRPGSGVSMGEDLGDLGDRGLGHQHHQGDRGPSHQHHSQSREVWSYGEPKSSRDRARILMGPWAPMLWFYFVFPSHTLYYVLKIHTC